jgi:hypothetical protein
LLSPAGRLRERTRTFTNDMTSSQPRIDRGRQQATLGIGLIVAAAIGLTAFECIAHRQLVFTALARMVLVILLGIIVFRGRGWASWLLALFALAGLVPGVSSLIGTRFSAVSVMLFAPVIVATLAGLWMVFLSPPARDFLRAQQALAARAKAATAAARPPNG